MAPTDIQSSAFAYATLKSERARTIGLLWVIATLLLILAVRLFLPDSPQGRLLERMVALLFVAAAYEALMLWFINRCLRTNRQVARWVWPANIFAETLIPTTLLLILVSSDPVQPYLVSNDSVRPYQVLVAPAALIYFFFIILSTLRLSPVLSRLTGFSAATGYIAVATYVNSRFAGFQAPGDFQFYVFIVYGVFILIGGLIAGAVAAQIRLHVAAALREAELRREKEKLDRDLEIARVIQQGLLPSSPPSVAGFEIAGWNQPADQTGGDYYDWQQLRDGRVVVVLADVTGHGVGPALVTAACRAYSRATLLRDTELETAMARINDLLVADLPAATMVTFVTGVIDPTEKSIQLLSAGHGPLLIYTASDRKIQRLVAHGVPFGFAAGMRYGPPQDIRMAPGDILVLVTDGFAEWENTSEEEFGIERLENTIRSSADQSPNRIVSRIHRAVTEFAAGNRQKDDLTAVIIKRIGGLSV